MKLQLNNITKFYGNKQVLDNISITFEENKIYGILGKNGSGKTTLLEIMNGIDFLYDGTVTIDDVSILDDQSRYQQVYLVSRSLIDEFPINKIDRLFKHYKKFFELFDVAYAYALLEKFNLHKNRKISELSLGERSILLSIIGFSVKSSFVLLDEPLEGLDPMNRELFYVVLNETRNMRKNTFVVTSHIVDELEHLLDEVFILKNNAILLHADIDQMKEKIFKISGEPSLLKEKLKHFQFIYKKENPFVAEAIVMGEFKKEDELQYEYLSLQEIFVAVHKGEL